MRGDRECVVCGKKYNYCGNCNNNPKPDETWRYMYCSENCRGIFKTLSAKAFGHIDDNTAAVQLGNLDLSMKMNFKQDYKNQINAIMSKADLPSSVEIKESKNDKKKNRKIVNSVDNEERLSY